MTFTFLVFLGKQTHSYSTLYFVASFTICLTGMSSFTKDVPPRIWMYLVWYSVTILTNYASLAKLSPTCLYTSKP